MPRLPALPPPLRPAVVLHGPNSGIDDLLAGFAQTLQARGFRVGGVVQRNTCVDLQCADTMDLVDLRTGSAVPISQKLGRGSTSCRVDPAGVAEAAVAVHAAIEDRVDLLVVNKFGALESQGGGMTQEIAKAVAEGIPVLTSVNGKYLPGLLSYVGDIARFLPCEEAALWRWWGGCRLYPDLLNGIEDQPVRRIVCRPPWVAILAGGGTGIARLPSGIGAPAPEALEATAARGLRALAEGVNSWDPFDLSLACAALNAHYNRPDEPGLLPANGLDGLEAPDGRTVVVGSFPGIRERLPHAQVIDAAPAPGEYPAEAADWLLPGAASVVLTAATLANRTLPRLLDLAEGARIALVGPTTPLTGRLFSYGIERLAGFLVDDPDGLASAILEGDGPRRWNAFGRQVMRKIPAVGC